MSSDKECMIAHKKIIKQKFPKATKISQNAKFFLFRMEGVHATSQEIEELRQNNLNAQNLTRANGTIYIYCTIAS